MPPPAPVAPALPFIFIGRMIDGNDVVLYLLKNGRQYSAKVNDTLDDSYRVDKIIDKLAVLTYLPMNVQQTMDFNSTAVINPVASALAAAVQLHPAPELQQQPKSAP